MKPIVLFYSRSGNTEKLANRISADLQCDTLRIEPEEKYGNYVSSLLRVMKENSNHIKPGFITAIPNLTTYDMVLLGFPTWGQDVPAFVAEFANKCDLQGKTVIPFTTFGMNAVNWEKKTLDKACNGAVIKLPFSHGIRKKGDYSEWLRAIKAL